jgi:hypothetical protein
LVGFADGKMLLEHAFSHVVILGAALQFQVGFDRDSFREGIVDRGLRSFVALPGPVVYVDARDFPCGAFGVELLVQFVGIAGRVGDFHIPFDDFRIPDLMKIR